MRIALYNLHFQTLGGGERRTAVLAEHLSHAHEVTLYVLEPANAEIIHKTFGVDLRDIDIVPLAGKNHSAEISATQPDLFINNSYGSRLPSPAPLGIYMCMFPDREPAQLFGYNVVTANSQFTAHWIAEWWGYAADIVYSPCAAMGPPVDKERIILNVARFSADREGNHHKRQDSLLDAFLDMTDAQESNWELHFVGNVGHSTEDEAFARHLQEKARERPAHFHFGLSVEHLRDLYRRASIYWHATGFGYDASEFPLKQEHFGMTIVEAMSAAVVPLARNAGGPRETIDHGRSGFLWNHLDELLAGTRALIADETLRKAMSNQAMAASERFTRGQFLARVDAIIDQLTSGRREVPVCAS